MTETRHLKNVVIFIQTIINEVIRKITEKRLKPKSAEQPFDCIKSLDPNKFPACRAVLEQHIKRVWFITK